MEQAVYKELKEICEKILNAGPQLAPADYLEDVRELEEKLILLDYLQYRKRSLGTRTEAAPSGLDEELIETLKKAEEQVSGGSAIEDKPKENVVNEPEDILPAKEQITETPPISFGDEEKQESESESMIHEPEDILPAKELAPEPEPQDDPKKTRQSINESFAGGQIKLGLNDRLAFTKHLFAGSQEDLNRVISQLNTFSTYQEAIQFIEEMVKPDYDWSNESDYEERLMDLIKARFGEE